MHESLEMDDGFVSQWPKIVVDNEIGRRAESRIEKGLNGSHAQFIVPLFENGDRNGNGIPRFYSGLGSGSRDRRGSGVRIWRDIRRIGHRNGRIGFPQMQRICHDGKVPSAIEFVLLCRETGGETIPTSRFCRPITTGRLTIVE